MITILRKTSYTRISRILTDAYLGLVFLGLPLVFHHLYFDITETKQAFFLIASFAYMLALLIARILFPRGCGVPAVKPRIPAAVWGTACFFLCMLAAGLLSEHPETSFLGGQNRYQGILTAFTYAAIVFVLSTQKPDLRAAESGLLLGGALAGILGLLNHFGVDPLGFTANLSSSDKGRFLSTIGNLDFYGSFFCIAFPVALNSFVRAGSKRAQALSAAALAAVSFGVLVAGSDAATLGLIAAALFLPLTLFANPRGMHRFFLGWAAFSLCALAFGLAGRRLPSATYLSSFTFTFVQPGFAGAFTLVCFAAALPLRRMPTQRLQRFQRPYIIMLLLAALAVILGLILINTAFKDLPLGGAERYLRWSDTWGTDRGKIWSWCARLYASFSPVQKLIGGGPGVVYYMDAQNQLFADAALDSAHNEYLHYLLSIGAAGLIAYLTVLTASLRSGIRKAADPVARGFTAALAAYAAQAVVSIAQPASTPLVFVIIGLLAAGKRNESD
jgi:hypothetical protein